jgi:hypothetical protein
MTRITQLRITWSSFTKQFSLGIDKSAADTTSATPTVVNHTPRLASASCWQVADAFTRHPYHLDPDVEPACFASQPVKLSFLA